jgi:hypothetical protein
VKRNALPILLAFIALLLLVVTRISSSTTKGYRLNDGTLTPWAHMPFAVKGYPGPVTPTTTVCPADCDTAPTLLAPADGGALGLLIPLFEWDSGENANATNLNLEIYEDPACTKWKYGYSSRYQTQGRWTYRIHRNLDPQTTYYWRAYLECGTVSGPYSPVWSFTTGAGGSFPLAPTLLAPADGSSLPGTSVTLEWAPVEGAAGYLLHYADGGYSRMKETEGTQMVLSYLDPDTTYEWWVEARNGYAWGEDSARWEFRTGAGGAAVGHGFSPTFVVKENGGRVVVYEE